MELTRATIGGIMFMATFLVAVAVLTITCSSPSRTAWADPPEGQKYTGAKKCAACHFKQFMSWKKTKHAKTFELLTAKYQVDPKCLKCHTTGYGQPTGFKDIATTPNLAGTSCEQCHGPGSEHEAVAKGYGKKKLTPEEEKIVRDSIWLKLPQTVCVECHKVQGHGESSTPKELQKP